MQDSSIEARVRVAQGSAGEGAESALWSELLSVFSANERCARISVLGAGTSPLAAGLIAAGAQRGADHELVIDRSALFQRPALFLPQVRPSYPLRYTFREGKRHPVRPPNPEGLLYRRQISELGSEFSLRTIDPQHDLATFHRWMNDARVSAFWEQSGSLPEQAAYLEKVTSDPHLLPVVGCFDGEPFGYFELYWAKEDRIAPYYQVDDYDRGLHMLVGEQRYRGSARVKAWLSSILHYLFLADPRTRAVVAEPRSDNAKMIRYLEQRGFHNEKLFDFPHKRAAMMVLPREPFFEQFCP